MFKTRIFQDLILLLRDTSGYTVKQPEDCFLNPPCNCSQPGKELQCEECPYLEACLSHFKTRHSSASNIKCRHPK